ncbi:MAG: MBL fold metallo-hydrolase [Patescibacteria group bacterium]|nr:MBL fold metallo-hydrolase [Patescibacteria group bacterium]
MKITFTGAAREVTGSRHLLEINGQQILLDCGMAQGHRAEADAHNRNLPFDASKLAAVILSHAHIDHCGTLPVLVQNGFTGKIYATPATHDLTEYMLLDSAHIAQADADFWSKRHPNAEPIKPIYTQDDVSRTMSLFHDIEYDTPTDILFDIRLTFYDAGHVLGSAMIDLEFSEPSKDETRRFVFTGDLGRPGMPILRDPAKIEETDFLMIESTYGDRLHDHYDLVGEQLADIIKRTAARGGKVVIPSFALDVFEKHFECFDEEMKLIWLANKENPFGFGKLRYAKTVEESMAIDSSSMPSVVISASGMCESGRILHHLKATISHPKNTLLFVGYQAEGTLGGRLRDGAREAKIFGEMYPVKAEVIPLDAFSAHADYQEIENWMHGMKIKDSIFVVHGEEKSELALMNRFTEEKKAPHVFAPKEGESFDI